MFIISNMKVGIRLAAAFGIIVTLLIVIGVTSITRINSINTAIASIVDDRYVKVRLAFDVRDGVNDQIKYLRGMVIDTLHPEKNAKRFGQLEEATQRTNNAMKK
ncbi:MCP four helix bundle domain-containing protein, partial [Pantoea anthophila]